MPTPDNIEYLAPETLSAIASIELRARMIVEGLMTGMHRSPAHGFSVEFAQHRQYTPGDDTRFLDWKVFGKTDKLYLKQYQKETNLDMVILVDVSGSMGYSSQAKGKAGEGGKNVWRKFDHAASLAAAMAFLALRQSDRVALTVFAEEARRATRLSNSTDHWRSIVECLTHAELDISTESDAARNHMRPEDTTGHTDLEALFNRVTANLNRRSLIVLISDLFDDPEHLERGLSRMSHRRHDVIVFQTLDDAEMTFPFRSPTDFLGLEAEGKLALDPAALRKAYMDVLEEHQREVERVTRKYRFDYQLLNTQEPLGPPLSHFLAKRMALVNKG